MLYDQITPTGAVGAFQAALNSNAASITNPFLTENDLLSTGITSFIMLAPNGGRWKVTVNNSGTLVTTAA